MKESSVLALIRNTLGRLPTVRLFRNSSGVFVDKFGHVVRYGVPSTGGGSDLIGWTAVVVTPEMVGTKVAIFTACEVKAEKGRSTPEQDAFIAAVQRAGGYAGIARSVDEALEICRVKP